VLVTVVFIKWSEHLGAHLVWFITTLLFLGASQQELTETERILHCNFPPAVHLLYRLCNGQEIPESDADEDESTSDLQNNVGLFGGYSFSHHFVNVHLLSLHQVHCFLHADSQLHVVLQLLMLFC
jgi:F-box protein 3